MVAPTRFHSASINPMNIITCCKSILTVALAMVTLLMHAPIVQASDLEEWLSSEARAELIAEFEANDCRLTLTEVSDLLFDYDASEQHIYTERLILMEPEDGALSFPVVLIKSPQCENVTIEPIKVSAEALAYANKSLELHTCSLEITALETLEYPADTVGSLTSTDRRNVVSELYNRNDVTFRYSRENGVDKLSVHKLTGACAAAVDD